jgi:hypothetical protein
LGKAVELAPNQSATSQPSVHPQKGRSAVTNGKRLHAVRPGVTVWSRRFRDVLNEIISDLGGHDAGLSEGQRQLARRAATISIMCEKLEGEAASGAEINLETYGTLTDRLGRCFQRLGLERRCRNVSPPTIDEIAADLEAKKQFAESVDEDAST